MSLLIKGMDMPKSCWECFFFLNSTELFKCNLTHKNVGNCRKNRHKTCPFVEIPTPHGRLIDADVLMDLLEKSVPKKNRGHQFYVFRHMLRNAPTVIEAEE